MVWLILAMLVCLALAAGVVGLVAVPARREGRQMLAPRGEQMVSGVTRSTDKVVNTARGATATAKEAARRRQEAKAARPQSGGFPYDAEATTSAPSAPSSAAPGPAPAVPKAAPARPHATRAPAAGPKAS